MMKSTLTLLTTLLLASVTLPGETTLKLAALFSDHMVMQRDQAVPVWGLARPGEEVAVEFAGQKKTAQSDADGKWRVSLDPLKASAEGRELTVQSTTGNRKSKITNVVVGDVWLCSGQSNMHFQMSRVENSRQEIAAADHPALRFFTVKDQFGQESMADAEGEWKPVSPATAAGCSAVAYHFAIELQRKVGVPIGLMVSRTQDSPPLMRNCSRR